MNIKYFDVAKALAILESYHYSNEPPVHALIAASLLEATVQPGAGQSVRIRWAGAMWDFNPSHVPAFRTGDGRFCVCEVTLAVREMFNGIIAMRAQPETVEFAELVKFLVDRVASHIQGYDYGGALASDKLWISPRWLPIRLPRMLNEYGLIDDPFSAIRLRWQRFESIEGEDSTKALRASTDFDFGMHRVSSGSFVAIREFDVADIKTFMEGYKPSLHAAPGAEDATKRPGTYVSPADLGEDEIGWRVAEYDEMYSVARLIRTIQPPSVFDEHDIYCRFSFEGDQVWFLGSETDYRLGGVVTQAAITALRDSAFDLKCSFLSHRLGAKFKSGIVPAVAASPLNFVYSEGGYTFNGIPISASQRGYAYVLRYKRHPKKGENGEAIPQPDGEMTVDAMQRAGSLKLPAIFDL